MTKDFFIKRNFYYNDERKKYIIKSGLAFDDIWDDFKSLVKNEQFENNKDFLNTKLKQMKTSLINDLKRIKIEANHPEVKDYLNRHPNLNENNLEINSNIEFLINKLAKEEL